MKKGQKFEKDNLIGLVAIAVLILIILSTFSISVFASERTSNQQSYFFSYFKTNDICFYISSGFLFGFTINIGAEYILGQWNISNVLPVDYAIGGKFIFNGYSRNAGITPVFMIHIGFSGINLDLYQGIGIGIKIPDGATFAEVAGLSWFVSKDLSIIFEYAYIGFSSWGFGVMFKI